MAKFRLLERGLLDAAQGVDDLHLRVSRRRDKSKKRNKKGGKDEVPDEVDEATEDVRMDTDTPDESLQEFMMRVNLYVAVHLGRAFGSKRDHYKDTLVYQARKDMINEFLKGAILNKCQNSDCAQ